MAGRIYIGFSAVHGDGITCDAPAGYETRGGYSVDELLVEDAGSGGWVTVENAVTGRDVQLGRPNPYGAQRPRKLRVQMSRVAFVDEHLGG
jgi:hypothetical protein